MGAQATSLLDVLGAPERREVERHLHRRRYGAGQPVFREGEPADCLHLVRAGHLDLRGSTPQGQVLTIRLVHPGGAVGETALAGRTVRRSGTLVALDQAETATLSRRDFEAIRRTHPAAEHLLVVALAVGQDERDQVLVDMLLPASARVWRRLAALAQAYGDGPVLVSQDVLAHMAATTRQTANRVLAAAAREGIVAVHRRHVEVLDHAALAARAASPGGPGGPDGLRARPTGGPAP